MTQVIGISSEISTWKCKVNIFCAVMLGSYWDKQLIRIAVAPVLAGQVTSEWYNVSITGGSCAHLVQLGEAARRILATLSPVGRMLWRSLNRKEESCGPRGRCLASFQVWGQSVSGEASSTLRGIRERGESSCVSVIVMSSIRNL